MITEYVQKKRNQQYFVHDFNSFKHFVTDADFVGRCGRILSPSVCLFACLLAYQQHKSKTNDLKVFKLGAGNDLGIC